MRSVAISFSILLATACTTRSEDAPPAGADSPVATTINPPAIQQDTSPRTTAPGEWTVNFRGIGPITAGMSLDGANAASGDRLIVPATLQECDFVRVRNAPDGLLVMVEQRSVSRVDVRSGTLTTANGAKIGDTEDRIRALYPGLVTVQPHKYDEGGRYLTVTSADPAESDHRIIFETDGKTVKRFRSGRLPAVQYVEGCS